MYGWSLIEVSWEQERAITKLQSLKRDRLLWILKNQKRNTEEKVRRKTLTFFLNKQRQTEIRRVYMKTNLDIIIA